MSNKYKISYSLEENRIYINRNEKGTEEKTVQVFSSKKEFPFLYVAKLNLSSEYSIWIAPGEVDRVPSWKEGFGVRILNGHIIEQESIISTEDDDRTRVLFITPHLSTGGCPQYLVKKIETYKKEIDAYVIEHDFLSPAYVVQRNRIIELVGEDKFFSLGDDKNKILEIIKSVNPEIVHFEEMPESYVPMELIDKIYSTSRNYFITETTHSSESKPSHKRFLPDKFIFCSKYSQESFKSLSVPSEIWEYPIEKLKRGSRSRALEELELDPGYVHVLNVGLFTPGKNQGEIFEIAKKFQDHKVLFHFVGNQAENFEHYWRPLMMNKLENCKVWGERDDVYKFMRACDIFYFSSTYELNPLVVKEALSWNMPVLMYNLDTYMGAYDEAKNVIFLDRTKNLEVNEKLLRKLVEKVEGEIQHCIPRTKIVHIVSDIFSEIEQKSIKSVSSLADANNEIEYTIHYNPPAKEIPSERDPMFFNENLRPGHFGCFEAFRKAIEEDFSDDYDYLIVCERDCVLEKEPLEIIDLLKKTYNLMKEKSITYFSFGDIVDLDNCYLQSEKNEDLPGGFSFLTNKIIGLQFIIFDRKGRDFLKTQFSSKDWYGMDIWLTEVYNQEKMKMGILNQRVTTQLDGFSIIDQTHKIFNGNKNEKKRTFL